MARAKSVKTRYLIIGNSAGGIGAAEAIREVDGDGDVIIISDEVYPVYSRPLISKYLSGERDVNGMLFRPSDFYERNDINLISGKKVSDIGLADKTAGCESGERIEWQKLLIATGGAPIVPPLDGLDKKGVFNFITLDDAKAIDEYLGNATSAVVIGGGLIGISAAEALTKRGIAVTGVEMKDRILNTILDEQASAIAAEAVEKAGVRIIADHVVAEMRGKELVTGVTLDNGESIPCSLVVVAIGVLPRVDLAKGTDIKINRGIVVDRRMATSHADVYACGDVSEAYDFVCGDNRLTPIWPNAYVGGRIAGFNMAGVKTEYPGGTAMNALNYFGIDMVSAGIVIPLDDNGYESLSVQQDGLYKKLLIKSDVIIGMICIGDIEKSGIIYSLMREKVNVRGLKDKLLNDDFGLIYLPKELWQERLGTPPPVGIVSPAIPPEEEVQDVPGE